MNKVLRQVTLAGHTDVDSRRDRQKVHVYVHEKGESILDNLVARHMRPVEFYKAIVTTELAKRGLYGNLVWKQRLGCSCPCSPGFLLVLEAHDDRMRLAKECTGTQKAPISGAGPLNIEFTIDLR